MSLRNRHLALFLCVCAAWLGTVAHAQVVRCTDTRTGKVTYTDGACTGGAAAREVEARKTPEELQLEREQSGGGPGAQAAAAAGRGPRRRARGPPQRRARPGTRCAGRCRSPTTAGLRPLPGMCTFAAQFRHGGCRPVALDL